MKTVQINERDQTMKSHAATIAFNETEATTQILNSAHLLQAFIECSDKLQIHAKKLVNTIVNPEADEDDRYLAAVTLYEILSPYSNEGDKMLGMDLDYANTLVKNHGQPPDSPYAKECDEAAAELEILEKQESSFAEKLGRFMAEKGMTQVELANRIGVGQSAIAMMLKRECRPQKRTLHRLAEAFGVPVSELWID